MRFLHDILLEGAAGRSGQTALIFQDETVTYGALQKAAENLAAQLAEMGVKTGDRVAYLDENSTEYPVVVFAVSMLGALFVPINFRFAPDEVAYVVNDAKPHVLLVAPAYMSQVEKAQPSFDQSVSVIEKPRLETLLRADAPAMLPRSALSEDAPAMVMYTSGTTGFPKGVLFSHRAYLANVKAIIESGELTSDDRMMVSLPLFHNGGLTAVLMPTLLLGAVAVIMARGFKPEEVLETVEKHRITSVMWVPTMLSMLITSDASSRFDTSSLSKIWYGSSPIAPDLLERSKRTFGADHYQFYGMTETGMTSVLKPEDHDLYPGSTGRAMPAAQLRLVDTQDRDVAIGEIGEVLSRQHPLGMIGYFGKDEETLEVLRDGWIHTGDLARNLGDGYFLIVDRKKDMIISGAENIYPREIELVLAGHPHVREVAVFGIPDATYGEAVCAAVVSEPDTKLTGEEVTSWCAEHLAGYKKPKKVLLMNELPKNAAGKILKNNLKASFWQGSASAI
ncbi:long-chain-fatty-acid--CoA ligase [uncultured Roseibium sp.]|uniref:class I adenylate-forming enzyme family protein n=1 Tax=uncultured Roseibium sp. TaxID=1936171 RepID=UPI003217ABBC